MRGPELTSVLTLLLLGLGAAPAAASAPTVTLEQSIATAEPIAVGAPVELTLRIEHPASASVILPETFEPSRWELIDTSRELVQTEGKTATVAVLRFGIFRPSAAPGNTSGTTTLEPFDVTVTSVAGEEVLQTEPVTVTVVSTLAADAEPAFADPRPPVAVWVDDFTLVYLGSGAALLGLLGLIGFVAARRRALMPAPPAPPRAAWEIALEKLSALAANDLVERGEYMIFWVRLSEAVREYLGRRYGFPPTELTSSEILGELAGVRWPNGLDEDDIAQFLRHCDRVKFGGEVPRPEESSGVLRRAFSIVELTRPHAVAVAPVASDTVPLVEGTAAAATTASREDTAPDRDRWAPPADYELPGAEDER